MSMSSSSSVLQVAKRFIKGTQWAWRRSTAHLRVLPDVIIIGAQKAGTTSLFHYLCQHPQVARPFCKEVHYFDGGVEPEVDHFARGINWYRAHFPLRMQMRPGMKAIEASPLYLFHPDVPMRIADLIPHAKLIAVLRDPTERAISHYFHEKRKGRETLSIREAFLQEEDRLSRPLAAHDFDHEHFIRFSYKRRGLYHEQLARYQTCFPENQLFVLSSDELYLEPAAALARAFQFIGVDSTFEVKDLEPRNTGRNRTDVDAAIYEELNDYFRPHNEELFEYVGRDFGWNRRAA